MICHECTGSDDAPVLMHILSGIHFIANDMFLYTL